ncbi:MAG: TrkA family potassium uptake protein [Saprospirales bacterium]|nr:TrkA family potassium uptake protein [Saprospirales bacterium]MBK8920666.1 TrkA family potassium uptake protein [Saprospirales bacterium]
MKFVIIGLGNFGASLGKRLIEEGHEVIGVDNNANHTTQLQDSLTYVISTDTTEEQNIAQLPIDEADYAVVSIGEDVGASLTTVALIKRHYPKVRIIARGISYVHNAILETMNVHEIINPEASYADQLAERFSLKGSLKAIPLDDNYEIVELDTPAAFVGKKVADLNLPDFGDLVLVTILRREEKTNFLGKTTVSRKSAGIIRSDSVIQNGDVLVLFGKDSDLRDLCDGK